MIYPTFRERIIVFPSKKILAMPTVELSQQHDGRFDLLVNEGCSKSRTPLLRPRPLNDYSGLSRFTNSLVTLAIPKSWYRPAV